MQETTLEERLANDLLQSWPTADGEAADDVLARAEDAVNRCPESALLWCIRGDLIQLSASSSPYELNDARRSYERAIAVDPLCPRAHESLGIFLEVHTEERERAEALLRKAIQLGAGADSYVSLARVLEEQGRRADALRVLMRFEPQEDERIRAMRDEILLGVWAE